LRQSAAPGRAVRQAIPTAERRNKAIAPYDKSARFASIAFTKPGLLSPI